MRLDELIKVLEAEDPDRVLPHGFHNPHSYRGYYDELSFEPATDIAIGEMLAAARSAVGATYGGWKGGDYTMSGWTDCWLAERGDTGDPINVWMLKSLLAPPAAPSVDVEKLRELATQTRPQVMWPGLTDDQQAAAVVAHAAAVKAFQIDLTALLDATSSARQPAPGPSPGRHARGRSPSPPCGCGDPPDRHLHADDPRHGPSASRHRRGGDLMAACHAEMCLNWTGQGCACLVMDIEPDLGEQMEADDEWFVRADEGTTDADRRRGRNGTAPGPDWCVARPLPLDTDGEAT